MTQKEAVRELHDRVRQCFTRHKFKVFGEALHWLHTEDFEILEKEAGEQGYSKFSTDILWLISNFGPKEPVDYNAMATRKVPALKRVAVHDPDDLPDEAEVADSPKISRPKRKTSRRRKRF